MSSSPLVARATALVPSVADPAVVRPRMRGAIHLWSLGPAAVAGAVLVTSAATTVSGAAATATAVYAASVVGLFATSAAFHRGRWTTDRARDLMGRLDQAMIFVLIAGTYTPLAVLGVPPARGVPTLIAVWAAAGAGVVLSLCWARAPRWPMVALYLALGWAGVLVLADLARSAGDAALVLVAAGGLVYSVGAVGFATRRPRGRPAVFGFHEYFHVATVGAAVCHQVAIWLVLHA